VLPGRGVKGRLACFHFLRVDAHEGTELSYAGGVRLGALGPKPFLAEVGAAILRCGQRNDQLGLR